MLRKEIYDECMVAMEWQPEPEFLFPFTNSDYSMILLIT